MEPMEVAPNPIFTQYNFSTKIFHSFTVFCHRYYVRTTITSDPNAIRSWLNDVYDRFREFILENRLIVGIGVQWHPNSDQPATLQLCVGYKCIIIQLRYLNSVPVILRHFLSSTAITFVGISVTYGGFLLRHSHHNLAVSRLIELRYVANACRGIRIGPITMERLALEILRLPGIVKSRSVGASNWESELLDFEQVEYAVIGAYISRLLGVQLQAWTWNRRY